MLGSREGVVLVDTIGEIVGLELGKSDGLAAGRLGVRLGEKGGFGLGAEVGESFELGSELGHVDRDLLDWLLGEPLGTVVG